MLLPVTQTPCFPLRCTNFFSKPSWLRSFWFSNISFLGTEWAASEAIAFSPPITKHPSTLLSFLGSCPWCFSTLPNPCGSRSPYNHFFLLLPVMVSSSLKSYTEPVLRFLSYAIQHSHAGLCQEAKECLSLVHQCHRLHKLSASRPLVKQFIS